MAKSIQQQVQDPALATSLWRLEQGIKEREAKKNWKSPPPKPRDPNDAYRGHSDTQKLARKRIDDRIMGERDD